MCHIYRYLFYVFMYLHLYLCIFNLTVLFISLVIAFVFSLFLSNKWSWRLRWWNYTCAKSKIIIYVTVRLVLWHCWVGGRKDSRLWKSHTSYPLEVHLGELRGPGLILISGKSNSSSRGVYLPYLGSKQSSNGYCRPDVLRMFYACSVMNSLQRVWNCSNLSTSTKVHPYQALIRSVLL